jgi:hypothetical protein
VIVAAIAPLAACSSAGGTGTVAYVEQDTGNIRTVDVATRRERLVDDGAFALVSISPDRQSVAYTGQDEVLKVVDQSGQIATLTPSPTGCFGTATWGPNESLSYCVSAFSTICGTGFLPVIGAASRVLHGYSLAVSADASTIAYVQSVNTCGPSTPGDLVVENADGSGHRVLVPGFTYLPLVVFAPDQQHVIFTGPAGTQMVALADATITTVGPGGPCGTPTGMPPVSPFSPDGSELLVANQGALAAIDLSTGATRQFAQVGSTIALCPAAFVDSDHVVYTHTIDTTPPGSDIRSYTQSVHLTDGTNDVVLAPTTNGDCQPVGVSADARFVAISCGGTASIVDRSGKTLARASAPTVLGISADSRGIITAADNGTISFLSIDGGMQLLATAWSAGAASYAP